MNTITEEHISDLSTMKKQKSETFRMKESALQRYKWTHVDTKTDRAGRTYRPQHTNPRRQFALVSVKKLSLIPQW